MSGADDPAAAIRQAMVDLAFARMVCDDSKRTLCCHPDDAGRVRWHIDQLSGRDDILKVVESAVVPAGTIYVVDEQAMEASFNESLQAGLRAPLWRERPDPTGAS